MYTNTLFDVATTIFDVAVAWAEHVMAEDEGKETKTWGLQGRSLPPPEAVVVVAGGVKEAMRPLLPLRARRKVLKTEIAWILTHVVPGAGSGVVAKCVSGGEVDGEQEYRER